MNNKIFYDSNGNVVDNENLACAYRDNYGFFIKQDSYGRFYNKNDMYSIDLERFDKLKGRNFFVFVKVKKESFESYIKFLKTKNTSYLKIAEREKLS